MLEIFVIAETRVSPALTNLAEKVLRRNIGCQLDSRNIPFGDLASYISVLGEANAEGSDPLETQRDAGSILQHASISILIVATEKALYEIATTTALSLMPCEMERGCTYVAAIATGTLEQYRTEIINGCSARASQQIRLFCTKLIVCVERMGLHRLFDQYSKKLKSDGTFLLTHKA